MASIFRLHNESMNVWTHGAGAILAVLLIWHVLFSAQPLGFSSVRERFAHLAPIAAFPRAAGLFGSGSVGAGMGAGIGVAATSVSTSVSTACEAALDHAAFAASGEGGASTTATASACKSVPSTSATSTLSSSSSSSSDLSAASAADAPTSALNETEFTHHSIIHSMLAALSDAHLPSLDEIAAKMRSFTEHASASSLVADEDATQSSSASSTSSPLSSSSPASLASSFAAAAALGMQRGVADIKLALAGWCAACPFPHAEIAAARALVEGTVCTLAHAHTHTLTMGQSRRDISLFSLGGQSKNERDHTLSRRSE